MQEEKLILSPRPVTVIDVRLENLSSHKHVKDQLLQWRNFKLLGTPNLVLSYHFDNPPRCSGKSLALSS